MAKPIRVVVFNDGELFIAQCLEVDISAQGKTSDEALKRVRTAFEAESDAAREKGKDVFEIGPAPAPFHAMFDDKVVNRTELAA